MWKLNTNLLESYMLKSDIMYKRVAERGFIVRIPATYVLDGYKSQVQLSFRDKAECYRAVVDYIDHIEDVIHAD